MDRLMDLTAESMSRLITTNFIHQVILIQQVLPKMSELGGGRIINLVSSSARLDPRAPAGEGGWGIAYSASKAAFGRVAGGINAEFAPDVLAFNVDPGNVITETQKALNRTDQFKAYGNESPLTAAAVAAYLATSPDARHFLGKWVYAPKATEELGLT
jgi:NAD(P)-dependent dehydrogenase (short-subunit alcohol dehydrogenase family)